MSIDCNRLLSVAVAIAAGTVIHFAVIGVFGVPVASLAAIAAIVFVIFVSARGNARGNP